MDKSVIIWPISKFSGSDSEQSTMTYTLIKHKDDVTSVCAHPTDPHIFVTGSMDNFVRLWRTNDDLTDATLLRSANVGEFISCVAISPDQSQVVVGTFEGSCLFYWTGPTDAPTGDPALKLVRKFSVTGLMSKIRILGFSFRRQAPEFLVTCSDSKLRLYDFGELKLVRTYKGASVHKSHQFVASFSDNGTFITSGSDDKAVCVWKTDPQKIQSADILSVTPPVTTQSGGGGGGGGGSGSAAGTAGAAGAGAASASGTTDGGDSNKKIVNEESFKISDREVICSVFINRQSGEEGFIKEGRFIVGGDKNGFITIFENPVLCEDDEYDDNVDSDKDDKDNDDDDEGGDEDRSDESDDDDEKQ